MAGKILIIAKTITETAEKITLNANNGDIIFNAAKSVKYAAKKDIIYDSFVAPEAEQTDKLLVTKVTCDVKEVEVGGTYTFKAVQFSRKLKNPKELEQVKWAYKIDGGEIQEFKNKGKVVGNTVVKKVKILEDLYDNNELTIYAYFQDKEGEGKFEAKIKFTPIELLLLFYVDEWDSGTKMFKEAAQTRLNNIKNSDWYDSSIHKVHCPPIQTIDEIIGIIPKYYKKYEEKGKVVMREMGVFSHSGLDGPICYDMEIKTCPLNKKARQMAMCGWEQIDLIWVEKNAMCVFYGCNSANEIKSFAKNISLLSNFKDVEVWGQSTSSFPSFVPDYRMTSAARSIPMGGVGWDVGFTYMVGGNEGEGFDSLHSESALKETQTNEEELEKMPKANNMNCYKNGTKIRSTHQGYFNDHR